ncbi:hypothetical protein GLAREA_10788 [Glarea lozoyensis ATCC 20868]|uniref:ceramidase n=1 Tax=Glarea lozoyensis (strain ATCC 20868 / MF5171) TaxID=1116229 RepID=S3D9C8_GLAL2|nr:uncharacterized protein GLAREA_10788 [Glarea lozoyensis ATCC 20868]EPE35092.1 hypothetical protein GLAREA_10788 [Glarea lozoyensis ATCC 20868]
MDLYIEASTPTETGPIPTYTIDLDLPSRQRYVQLATDFGPKMRALVPLLDEVLEWLLPFKALRLLFKYLASILLRRVHSEEETEELRGMCDVTGVDMFVFVAVNVLLDSMLGCTSGAVLVEEDGPRPPTMMHFRTLDWGMDGLRNLLVTLEFVRSKSPEPKKVIARSITYAGFVGVLTGVRKDLSVSFNFRGVHRCSSARLRYHQLLVLLGFRPSIASYLRKTMFPEDPSVTLATISSGLQKITSSPCYIILCSGTQTDVIERDLVTSRIRSDDQFIVHTNHDETIPSVSVSSMDVIKPEALYVVAALKEFMEDSKHRAVCFADRWAALKGLRENAISQVENDSKPKENKISMSIELLVEWVKTYPTMNECSHFGCILDPSTGTVKMLEREGFGDPEDVTDEDSEDDEDENEDEDEDQDQDRVEKENADEVVDERKGDDDEYVDESEGKDQD